MGNPTRCQLRSPCHERPCVEELLQPCESHPRQEKGRVLAQMQDLRYHPLHCDLSEQGRWQGTVGRNVALVDFLLLCHVHDRDLGSEKLNPGGSVFQRRVRFHH